MSLDEEYFIISYVDHIFSTSYSRYRDYFIRNLHDALSGHSSNNVNEAV